MKQFFTFLLCFVMYGSMIIAQTASLTIGSETVCAGQEVVIPVNVSDLDGAAAISLYIDFDNIKLGFVDLENIDSKLSGELSYALSNSVLVILWSSLTTVSYVTGKLFDIRFNFNGNSTGVEFKSTSKIVNYSLEAIPCNFNNGVIGDADPVINTQPQDTSINEKQTAIFRILAGNVKGYSWEEWSLSDQTWRFLTEGGNYSGVSTSVLSIGNINAAYNGNRYRCKLSNYGCIKNSSSATLTVNSTGIESSWKRNPPVIEKNFPNPFNHSTKFTVFLQEPGTISLKVYDMNGQLVLTNSYGYRMMGTHYIELDAGNLNTGIYNCVFRVDKESTTYQTQKKIFKLL